MTRYAYNPTTGEYSTYSDTQFPSGLPAPWVEATAEQYYLWAQSHIPRTTAPSTTTPSGVGVGWQPGEFEAALPQAAWLRGFGLPALGQNPFQKWLASRVSPAFAGWTGEQILPGATPRGFEGIATPGGLGGIGATALAALRRAMGLAPAEGEQWRTEMGGGLGALLQGALGAGGRGFASPIARIMAGRLPELETGWEALTRGGEIGGSFLDYLRQKFGL